ncbi:cobalamin synthesis G family protein [[Clostridium] sordellii ATCC 9714]|nr:cobalamin synthesis G family protein [[Clostridium] sordellii ATCC 9714] [Paeniclostridium sordellii ATCC 9714]
MKKSIGVYSVAEPVAYLLSNKNLIVKKLKYKGITFSIGRLDI